MIGRNSIKSLRRLARITYASLSLLLGWLGVIVGFGLLVVGILGAVVGQIIWSVAWIVMTAPRGKLANQLSATRDTASQVNSTLPGSQSIR